MDELHAVVERVSVDPDLVARLSSAASVDERRELLRDAGIEVTDEIREQTTALGRRSNVDVDDPESWDVVELSEDDVSELGRGRRCSLGRHGGTLSVLANTFVTVLVAG